jgi:hypothetical protein
MRAGVGNVSGGVLLVVMMACLRPSLADAQFVGGGGSLGGYGASSGFSGAGMGGGGAMVIPYGGMTEGFMPGRLGGGSSLSFRPRPSAGMNASRSSSRLSTTTGGMTSTTVGSRAMSGGMGRGIGPGSFLSKPMGSGGAGPGVMPPSIGYPFRQPPSLLSPASGGAGMSM